jgi:GT2 family glycosyltransferase
VDDERRANGAVRLAAVVLTHGEHDCYRLIVADLLQQGVPGERICVVHNPVAPEDRHVEVPAGVFVLRMPDNLGYAEAMNAGMRHHLERGADWIWLLTHEVRLWPGATQAMLAAAEADSYGALGPVLVTAGTNSVFSLGGARTRFGRPYNAGFGTPLREHELDRAAIEPFAWVDGSTIMLRAEALRAAGLYDTSLFIYAEDATLCLRLERAGWRTGVVQGAIAEQSAGQVSRPGPVSFLLARNGLRYARQAVGRRAIVPVLLAHMRESIHLLRLGLTGPRRRAALIQCYASWIGVLAFFAGHTGPPPGWLPGRGDMGKA